MVLESAADNCRLRHFMLIFDRELANDPYIMKVVLMMMGSNLKNSSNMNKLNKLNELIELIELNELIELIELNELNELLYEFYEFTSDHLIFEFFKLVKI